MDKISVGSKRPEGCCEKLYTAIRNTSPFVRTVRFPGPITSSSSNLSTTIHKDRCIRVSSLENSVSINQNSPHAPLKTSTSFKDRCPRILKQSVAPAPADHKKEADQKVAIIHDHKVSSPENINQAKGNKETILPIHGHENKVPSILHGGGEKSSIAESIDGLSSDYIDRAGRKIRAPTNVGIRNRVSRDSFNERISEFIRHTKNKFHSATSFNEVKEKRLK